MSRLEEGFPSAQDPELRENSRSLANAGNHTPRPEEVYRLSEVLEAEKAPQSLMDLVNHTPV